MIKNSVKRLFSFVFFLLFVFTGVFSSCVLSFDDAVLVEWTQTYGGEADDSLYAVKQTSDGGFLLAGTTESFGAENSDVLVIKTDEFGVTEWTEIVGGQGIDRVWSALENSQGNFIVGGGLGRPGTYDDKMALWCFDPQGNIVWNRTYQDYQQWGRPCMLEVEEEHIMVSGWSEQGFLLFKMDFDGELVWSKTYDIGGAGGANDICRSDDDGFVLYGEGGNDEYELWDGIFVKTDSQGNLEWLSRVGGDAAEEGYSLCKDSDGSFISIGHSRSFGLGLQIYVAKVDSDGEERWFKTFGNQGMDTGFDICAAGLEGCVAVGSTNNQVYVFRLDSNGNMLWSKEIGGSDADSGIRVEPTSDGGFIVGGNTQSFGDGANDFYLIKLSGEIDNSAPSSPSVAGESQGKIKTEYTYEISSIDPEENEVFLFVDWGDDTNSGWLGPFDSGESVEVSHLWDSKGSYTIRVKAKDSFGAESDWSSLPISMPKSRSFFRVFDWLSFLYQMLSSWSW